MTRYEDMMQKMTVDEMARLIARQRQPCERCVWVDENCFEKSCALGIEGWLLEEKEIKDQGVIHAHWIKRNYDNADRTIYKCSNCNTEMFSAWNYCPNCGADMRGEL